MGRKNEEWEENSGRVIVTSPRLCFGGRGWGEGGVGGDQWNRWRDITMVVFFVGKVEVGKGEVGNE